MSDCVDMILYYARQQAIVDTGSSALRNQWYHTCLQRQLKTCLGEGWHEVTSVHRVLLSGEWSRLPLTHWSMFSDIMISLLTIHLKVF